MKTLIWDGEKCVNPPSGWTVKLVKFIGGTWQWVARSRHGRNETLACDYSAGFFATPEAAQIACEVFLWRLGILPLPEREKNTSFPASQNAMVAQIGTCRALSDDGESWAVVSPLSIAHGGGGQAAYEAVFRALIAAAVEAGE